MRHVWNGDESSLRSYLRSIGIFAWHGVGIASGCMVFVSDAPIVFQACSIPQSPNACILPCVDSKLNAKHVKMLENHGGKDGMTARDWLTIQFAANPHPLLDPDIPC